MEPYGTLLRRLPTRFNLLHCGGIHLPTFGTSINGQFLHGVGHGLLIKHSYNGTNYGPYIDHTVTTNASEFIAAMHDCEAGGPLLGPLCANGLFHAFTEFTQITDVSWLFPCTLPGFRISTLRWCFYWHFTQGLFQQGPRANLTRFHELQRWIGPLQKFCLTMPTTLHEEACATGMTDAFYILFHEGWADPSDPIRACNRLPYRVILNFPGMCTLLFARKPSWKDGAISVRGAAVSSSSIIDAWCCGFVENCTRYAQAQPFLRCTAQATFLTARMSARFGRKAAV